VEVKWLKEREVVAAQERSAKWKWFIHIPDAA